MPAYAVTVKISGDVNASSLMSGVDYEVDAQCAITIGEDNVTITSLFVDAGKALEIKGGNSGSLTVTNGISAGHGALLKQSGGIVNVRLESTATGSNYGVKLIRRETP